MALPGVSVNITNGNLGRVAGTVDSVCGLMLTGAAVASVLTLGTPYQIFSPDDANLLGLNSAYDVTNATNAFRHIVDFYSVAPLGTELWIIVISPANTLKDMADPTKLFAKVLLDAGQGRIKMLGLTRNPANSYAPVITEGIDPDTVLAIPAAHSLAESFAAAYAPVRVLVEGRDFSGTVADLRNLRQNAHNRVGVVLAGLGAGLKAAAVGLALGKFAANPVQRNIGHVKDGSVPGVQAYLSNGQPMSSFSIGQQTSLHDKGYIFLRKYPNLNGFYFNDDCARLPMTTAAWPGAESLTKRRSLPTRRTPMKFWMMWKLMKPDVWKQP